MNSYLILAAFAAVGWLFVNDTPPSPERAAPAPESRVAPADPATSAHAVTGPVLEARQAPVPLVRHFRPDPVTPPVTPLAAAPAADPQQQTEDDVDRKAAKAAVEADGYKRVTVVGKAANGAWRAKGFRGTTEIMLTVDGMGRVSMD